MAKSVSTKLFKNDKIVLLPTYTGKRTAKIKIEDILPMFDLEWLMETVTFDRGKEIKIFAMAEGKQKFWSGK